MRRVWESLLKLHYSGDADAIGMINHLSMNSTIGGSAAASSAPMPET